MQAYQKRGNQPLSLIGLQLPVKQSVKMDTLIGADIITHSHTNAIGNHLNTLLFAAIKSSLTRSISQHPSPSLHHNAGGNTPGPGNGAGATNPGPGGVDSLCPSPAASSKIC